MNCGYLARSFDLLNVRDLDLIAQSAARCDRLTLAVLGDETVERLLGRAPIVPLGERLELVRHLRGVDEVIVHDQHDFTRARDHLTVFEVEGEASLLGGPGKTVVLSPERQTASRMLLDALRADPQPADPQFSVA